MLISLTMPQFGESITEARIIRWLKKEGDPAKESEPLVEMETQKAVFSYECPFRGKLAKILEKNDTEVAVGTEIAHFEVSEEDGKKYLSLGIGRPVGVSGGKPAGSEVPSGIAPLLRSLAKEHGIPIDEVTKISGTGPGGRVTKEDFSKYLERRAVTQESSAGAGIRRIPLSPIRARIAENMSLSRQKIPHAGCSVEADLSLIEKWRGGRKKAPGYLPFAIVAALQALKKVPVVNSSWREEQGRKWIEQYDHVHLGVAVATGQGLIVPVIRNAHQLSFEAICRELDRLVEAARKGNLKPQDLSGGTFTVNNAGALGAFRSDQIIPHPQAAILAINRVARRPWVVGKPGQERIEVRPILSMDLAFDHRIIDGDQAVKFLVEVRNVLETFDGVRLKAE